MAAWTLYEPGPEWDMWAHRCPNSDIYHYSDYARASTHKSEGRPVLVRFESPLGLVVHPIVLSPLGGLHEDFSDLFDALSFYGYGGPAWQCFSKEKEAQLLGSFWAGEAIFLREMGVVSEFVRLHPLIQLPPLANIQQEMVQKGSTVAVDLSLSGDDLWRRLSQNHRRNIKKAQHQGVTVTFDHNGDELDTFLNLYTITMNRVHARADYYFSRSELACLFLGNSSSAYIAVARQDGKPVAALMNLSGNDFFHYHLGGSDDAARRMGASHLLIFESLLFAKKLGKPIMHLGGGYGGKDDGLMRFKRGFGGTIRPFFVLQRVLWRDKYECVCSRLSLNPGSTNYFPAYRDPEARAPGVKTPSHQYSFSQPRPSISSWNPVRTFRESDGGLKSTQNGSGNLRILIVGAGGHAQVVADAIASRRLLGEEHTVVGFLDDEENLQEAPRPGTIVLGKISQAKEFEHDAVVMGIGDNRTRAKIYAQLVGANERIMTVIHARATVAPHVVIGDGTVVVAGAVINPGASIGPNVIINTGATVDHHNKVEAHVHLCPGVHLGGTVTIREGAFLGIGCSVLPNKTVGPWSVVGSGAVVIRDVPAGVTVVGVPAREMRKR